jgi:hypothetical protein
VHVQRDKARIDAIEGSAKGVDKAIWKLAEAKAHRRDQAGGQLGATMSAASLGTAMSAQVHIIKLGASNHARTKLRHLQKLFAVFLGTAPEDPSAAALVEGRGGPGGRSRDAGAAQARELRPLPTDYRRLRAVDGGAHIRCAQAC